MSDNEIQNLINTLKNNLSKFPEGMNSLEFELESASKHVPAYLKIVKGHVDQLRDVLQLENHNHRTLDSINLTKPVQQLMEMFGKLHDEDVQLLEELSYTARNWQPETSDEALAQREPAETSTT